MQPPINMLRMRTESNTQSVQLLVITSQQSDRTDGPVARADSPSTRVGGDRPAIQQLLQRPAGQAMLGNIGAAVQNQLEERGVNPQAVNPDSTYVSESSSPCRNRMLIRMMKQVLTNDHNTNWK